MTTIHNPIAAGFGDTEGPCHWPSRNWSTEQAQWQTFVQADIRHREQQVTDENPAGS